MRSRVTRLLLGTAIVAGTAIGGAGPSFGFEWSSLWPFSKREEQAPIPDPIAYVPALEVQGGDKKLERTLRRASALVSQAKTPTSGLVGLIARARQDLVNLTSALYENARYSAQIEILVAGRPLATLDPFVPVAERPVPVTIRIRPGPAFTFGAIDPGPLPPGLTLRKLKLETGDAAGSARIVAAEQIIAERWRELGHPLAKVERREVVADHKTGRVDLRLHVSPGPTANFGRVSVTGANAVLPPLILRRAGIGPEQYSSKITKRAETRLRELGVFDGVRVVPSDRLDRDGTIPVSIEVSERKPRVIGGGVSYSSTEGAGIEAFWAHRNLFGGAENIRLSGGISRLLDGPISDVDFKLAARFQKPAVFDAMTDFTLRVEARRETTEAYRVTGALAEAGLVRTFSDTLTGGLAVEIERSRTEEALLTSDHLIATVTGTMTFDTRDNKLDPTSGFRVSGKLAPAYDFLFSAPFLTAKVEASAYYAVDTDQRFVVAGRIAAGSLITNDILNVSADRRFYAGGGGSVRGFGYKHIAPRDAIGDLIGGRSLLEGTLELRYRINETFGVATFIDAGNAYEGMVPGFTDLKFGAGVGLRYITPVGPLRVDFAVPLNRGPGDPAWGLYVGLGQSF